MRMMTVTIEGVRTLRRQLEGMSRAAQRSTVRRAARAGARLVGMEARRRAPRSQRPRHPKGHAYRTIRWVEVDSWPDRAEFAIGPTGHGWYLILHEIGTSRFAAQPHLRPALEAVTGQAVDEMGVVFRDAIIERIQREARRKR